jgi:transcription-repair coupling factor (superfamily II helicase)
VVDAWPADAEQPIRFDFWGDRCESIHEFDPLTQRRDTGRPVQEYVLVRQHVYPTNEAEQQAYLSRYRQEGWLVSDDPVHRNMLRGERSMGDSTLWPLCFDTTAVLSDYLGPLGRYYWQEGSFEQARGALEAVDRAYRQHHLPATVRLLPPSRGWLTMPELEAWMAEPRSRLWRTIPSAPTVRSAFDHHKLGPQDRSTRAAQPKHQIAPRPAEDRLMHWFAEAQQLKPGSVWVHWHYGIGQFLGLETIAVEGQSRDCLLMSYAGGDRLFIPVEQMEHLRYYGETPTDPEAILDRLGSAGWQKRRQKAKEKIDWLAERLLAIAAERASYPAPKVALDADRYARFCDAFPYALTPDQEAALAAIEEDFRRGTPMDRLLCGDVGFGKTEVALRAAHMMVSDIGGWQVALIAPTTLLARQHAVSFAERFRHHCRADGRPITTAMMSRLTSQAERRVIRERARDGALSIVVGTHAMLTKPLEWSKLGLIMIDEEQHFGVAHKEALKALAPGAHWLALSATPIPRTLQLSLCGIRGLSLLGTPPPGRRVVQSWLGVMDDAVLQAALERELLRQGKAFVVAPYIEDLAMLERRVMHAMPEARVAVLHGQCPIQRMEATMHDFLEGPIQILISTAIVESGLHIPEANTMIVYRPDRFGSAALHQLRGRVGRGERQGYAYFLLPAHPPVAASTMDRLEAVVQHHHLGSGFSIAAEDMDRRGYGNLLGDEQSGHVREIGVELYQQLLKEAIADRQLLGAGQIRSSRSVRDWVSEVSLGLSLQISGDYIPDIGVRLSCYRRLGQLASQSEIEDFRAELVDRFGPLPVATEHLLAVVTLQHFCRDRGIRKIDAGPRAVVVEWISTDVIPATPLLAWMSRTPGARPKGPLAVHCPWAEAVLPPDRLTRVQQLLDGWYQQPS